MRGQGGGLLTHSFSTYPPLLLCLMIVAYALTAGSLALRRHTNLDSHALDMGYADQVTWNTLHGRLFRFTVFRDRIGAEQGRLLGFGPGADRDSLLAYHVELLFLPLSLLYLIHSGPQILIVLLTIVLALGALPAYWIARRQLHHRGAALAFAAMYLLFPSIQAANLADFHIVSMMGAGLLFALYFLLARRYWAFVALAIVCIAAREEVGLLVGMMGLYAWLAQGQRRLGIAIAGLAFGWVALSFKVIIPHFSGGTSSLFATRYEGALAQLGLFWTEITAGRPVWPIPDYTVRYVTHMLASTSFLALLGPFQLAIAAPALAVNGLSSSTWQHGGGAHYSAEAVPGLIVAAIFGTRWLAQQGWRWLKVPPTTAALAIALVGLGIALVEARREAILPPAKRFAWLPASSHAARLQPLLAAIPDDAIVSAQSNVFPHLSNRGKVYVFPTVDDAEYVLMDVAWTSDPLPPDLLFNAAHSLLANPQFALRSADDGFLLLQRRPPGASGSEPSSLPPSFYSFARAPSSEQFQSVQASFERKFEVVGYRLEPLPAVRFGIRRVRPVLYFRAQQPVDTAYRLTLFVIGPDNLARIADSGNATQRWYPPDRWQPGELIRVRYPPLTYRDGERLGIGAQIGTAAVVPRLRVTGATGPVLDDGRVFVLGPLP